MNRGHVVNAFIWQVKDFGFYFMIIKWARLQPKHYSVYNMETREKQN